MARIVQVAPDVYPLPAEDYGGIEKIVYQLTETLAEMGHEVFLYAPRGSRTRAHLIPYTHTDTWNGAAIAQEVAATLPEGVDIVHDHTHYSEIGKLHLPVPVICTVHIPNNNGVENAVYVSPKALELYGGGKGLYVYNGLNPDEFEFSPVKDDYLLYLGTLDWTKGTHLAMEIAERTGRNLIVAGPCHLQNFRTLELEPRLKRSPLIQYIGPVSGKLKQLLLKHARCLLFPTQWQEPFGLVMIEAMACGTPVLGMANGAVPEVLSPFPELICSSLDEMTAKVTEEDFPPAETLRQHVLKHFTIRTMTENYMKIYESVCGESFSPL